MAVTEKSEHRDVTSQTAPPPYEATSGQLLDIHQDQPAPGPATSGSFYREDEQPVSIIFKFCPDPAKFLCQQDWSAELFVKCRDVPRLMREGFYWDAANVIREEGYLVLDQLGSIRKDGKKYAGTRHYFLKDLQRPPRWIATIELHAVHFHTLTRFDLGQQLTQERIRLANATSQASSQHYIWRYHHQLPPEECFNVIYGDMPMEGWWPWPRKESEEANTGDGRDQEVSGKGVAGDRASLI
ncbi:hypothetical protein HD806DRAFT_551239 [Xylariaceae sp. AK1471]|nr:hypothetical protein HD806DRAFT_551239 [Xylariaceae sp. AK1471]